MKRSEFFRQRVAFWRGERVALSFSDYTFPQRDCQAAEAAGVRWDPEEEPLPTQLYFKPQGEQSNHFSCVSDSGDEEVGLMIMTERVGREAVRRYNAWPKLLQLADCIGDDDRQDDLGRRGLMLAILDGPESGS